MSRFALRWLLAAALAWGLSRGGAGALHAAPIYSITSFDANDATTTSSKTVNYDPSLVTIVVAPGLTGTTANQLLALQTINGNAGINTSSPRFQNTDVDAAQTNGTLIADASANYFQFGVSGGGGGITLDSLSFQAKKATANAATRGYNVVVSINGGPYAALGSANLTADRNLPAFDSVTLNLPGAPVSGVSSVDFRVNSTGGGIEYANFAINGTVPEPSALSLLGGTLAAASLGRRTRRRGRRAAA